MSLIIPPGYGLAAFIFTGAQGTQPYVTTIGVSLTPAEGDFVGAANSCFIAYRDNMLSRTTNQMTLDRVTLSVGQDGPGGSVDSNIAPAPGTSSGVYPPSSMSPIARKVTNQFGRAGRGRMFLPGAVSEAEVDQDGTLIPASRTALNTALNNFRLDLITGNPGAEGSTNIGVPPFLLHSSPLAPTPIESLVVSDLVGWIRGRIR